MNIAELNHVDTSKYENLLAYGEYLKEFSSLDLEQLMDEMEKLEDEVYVSKLTADDARLTRSIDRYLRLLDSAYKIQMSTKDFNLFKINEPDFLTASYQAFLNRKLAEAGYFEDIIPYENILEESQKSLEEFYQSVSERDLAFMKNIEKEMDIHNRVAVVITGGYHTQHLSQLLKDLILISHFVAMWRQLTRSRFSKKSFIFVAIRKYIPDWRENKLTESSNLHQTIAGIDGF